LSRAREGRDGSLGAPRVGPDHGPPASRVTDNARAAALVTGSSVAFAVNDTFMKLVSEDVPLMQAVFLRGIVVSVLFYAALRWRGAIRLAMPRRDRWLVVARTSAEVLTAYFFLTALFNMPLANVTAILQVLPLSVALASAVFLGEPIGWRRFVAIAVGFFGVMLIVRPGTDGFTIYSVYALIAVGLITVRDITTRLLSPAVPSMSIALVTAIAVCLAGGAVTLTQGWAPVGGTSLVHIPLAAGAILFGYLLSVMMMRLGEVSFVAPFRYSALVAAVILGILVFDEWPDMLTVLGSVIVVATGLFVLYRERQMARAARLSG